MTHTVRSQIERDCADETRVLCTRSPEDGAVGVEFMDSRVQRRIETIATDKHDIEVEPRSCSIERRCDL
ncbi:hypothetical protein [Microbacterium sp.]|uniref:hypothetical protein n=1 Tax=Microbacterium sp. TaxID=51671 RepID=UPI0039E6A8D3